MSRDARIVSTEVPGEGCTCVKGSKSKSKRCDWCNSLESTVSELLAERERLTKERDVLKNEVEAMKRGYLHSF